MTIQSILHISFYVGIVQLISDLIAKKFIFSSKEYKRCVSNLKSIKIRYDKELSKMQESSSSGNDNATTTANPTSNAQMKKKKQFDRIEQDYNDCIADVSRKHMSPKFMTSIAFLFLYRYLSSVYKDQIVAVLPFRIPITFIRRMIVHRNLFDYTIGSSSFMSLSNVRNNILSSLPSSLLSTSGEDVAESTNASTETSFVDIDQTCSFLLIYILCTLSIKFIISEFISGTQVPSEANKDGQSTGLLSVLESTQGKKFIKLAGLEDMHQNMKDYEQEYKKEVSGTTTSTSTTTTKSSTKSKRKQK